MRAGRQFLLLPVLGAASAIASFVAAGPFVGSLLNRNLPEDDPASQFTYGTTWGNVNHCVFGALLCGSFCFIIAANRKGIKSAMFSGLLGLLLGTVAGMVGDGGSDLIGIHLARINRAYIPLSSVLWSLIVPTVYAYTIALALGPTRQRIKRATVASISGMVASFLARILADVIAIPVLLMTGRAGLSGGGDPTSMAISVSLPVWMVEAIAVGIVLGFVIANSEAKVRVGSIRLILGRNEGKEWSLDYRVNRIGASEQVEIPIFGIAGVARLHAQIELEQKGFILHVNGNSPALLNGQPVSSAWLSEGDSIQLGLATLVFSGRGAVSPANRYAIAEPSTWSQIPAPATGVAIQTASAQVPVAAPDHRLIDATGNFFILQNGSNTIGRDANNTVVLGGSTSVSRRHAEINVQGMMAILNDLQSSNGTRINGSPVPNSTPMKDGDQIQFGEVSVVYRSPSQVPTLR